jgi:hypothetical protein
VDSRLYPPPYPPKLSVPPCALKRSSRQWQSISGDVDTVNAETANRIVGFAQRTQPKTGQDVEKIEHIVSDQRQISNAILRQDVTDRSACGRNHRIGFRLHLNCRGCARHR